jgi:hypothetical protein
MTIYEKEELHQELIKAIHKGNLTHVGYWIYQGANPEKNNWAAPKLALQKNKPACFQLLIKNCEKAPTEETLFELLNLCNETHTPQTIYQIIQLAQNAKHLENFSQLKAQRHEEILPYIKKFLKAQHHALKLLESPTKPLDL